MNEKELLLNILTYSKENGVSVFTLKELFSHFPVSKGLEEVVAYLSVIKENYKNSSINEEDIEEIIYEWNGRKYVLTLPKVMVVL